MQRIQIMKCSLYPFIHIENCPEQVQKKVKQKYKKQSSYSVFVDNNTWQFSQSTSSVTLQPRSAEFEGTNIPMARGREQDAIAVKSEKRGGTMDGSGKFTGG